MKKDFIRAIAIRVLPLVLVAPAGVMIVTAPPAVAQTQRLAVDQIDSILAPIALYPDDLLMQVLMASTYPAEILEAYYWRQEPANTALQGDALVQALEAAPWDPSVKALVPVPQVLDMMATNYEWTQQLGVAFTTQQAEVMTEVQSLRRRAADAGALTSSDELAVEQQGDNIVIAPAMPDTLYVPVYDPMVVYGGWPYPSVPPVYFAPPPGYIVTGVGLGTGIGFGIGVGIVAPFWGYATPVWSLGRIHIDAGRYHRINRWGPAWRGNVWRHVPHRRSDFRPPPGRFRPVRRPVGGFRPPRATSRSFHRAPPTRPGGVRRPPTGTHRPPTGTYRPPPTTHRPPTGAYRPPPTTHRPPTGAYRPPPTTHRPPTGTYRPPTGTHRPPTGTYRPPPTTHRPPTGTYRPPATIHRPPPTAHRPAPATRRAPPPRQQGGRKRDRDQR